MNMRRKLGVVLLGVVAAFYIWQSVPEPPSIAVQPSTPESVRAEFEKEQKQAQYDRTQAIITAYFARHRATTENAEPLAHAAVDWPVVHNERANARLYAALAYYESGGRSDRISSRKSIGLLQVNRQYHPMYTVRQLLNPWVNAYYGASILSGYVKSYGLFQGLHRYNGLGPRSHPTDDSYAVSVYRLAGFEIPEGAVYAGKESSGTTGSGTGAPSVSTGGNEPRQNLEG